MSADDDRMRGIMRARRVALWGLVAAVVLGGAHGIVGGGLPLWVYVMAAVCFASCVVSMDFPRGSALRQTRQAEPDDD
jgi:hypothetical protein